jgi:predicted SnoaL-like aldol condensation-catalyzing enzyme
MADKRTVSPVADYTDQERRNLAAVLDFYENGVNKRNYEAAFRNLGDHYIQHNPSAPDGREGFLEFFGFVEKNFPNFRVEIQRIFVEGDLVALHVRSFDGPTKNGEAGVDMFRLQDGKIIEHWDVIQPIPDSMPHDNSMF